ncbi:MAG: hypothetical protein HS111_20990 [Kofleriaceae bacterium]|nr:hypothetical protein [Kofleriaceae bacterium]
MSAEVRTHGASVYTVATCAMRLRFRFSPVVSRVSSRRGVVSAARFVAGRRSAWRIAMPLPSKLRIIRSSVASGSRSVLVERVEVLGRADRQLLDLPLAARVRQCACSPARRRSSNDARALCSATSRRTSIE